jgi:hypothetical protein
MTDELAELKQRQDELEEFVNVLESRLSTQETLMKRCGASIAVSMRSLRGVRAADVRTTVRAARMSVPAGTVLVLIQAFTKCEGGRHD